ncbi:MAG TPA: hypothetical protein VE089_00050 [Nitrososphaeraceae archaeon]|jgi:hypothetical protein|nr:hypothetical protein [Nitrososphaeraceae archaeon]
MNAKRIFITPVIASIAVAALVTLGVNNSILTPAWADGNGNDHIDKYHSLKSLAKAIDDNKFDDDHIKLSSFKHSDAYKDADHDERDCIKDAYENGQNLADYEILDCADGSGGY